MATRAFVFPGQGSQAVGMIGVLRQASAAAREVLGEVDEALQQSLSKLMADGPLETLTLTENAQPAIMAASMAVVRALEVDANVRLTDHGAFVAGHSLGEYSALCAVGSLTVADTARLLKLRGQAMQAAVPVGEGAMAALLGASLDDAKAVVSEAADGQVCDIANDNAPGQVVISGHKAAVDRAIAIAKTKGKKAMLLNVSAPFHCALMQPAADAMAKALDSAALRAPFLPVVTNVSAAPVSDAASLKAQLVQQVTGRVRWRESVEALVAQGVDTIVELGAGKVLSGMIKRIAPDVTLLNVETPDDIDALLKSL
jgi:[acyl-carrier-protein] S-malonyltransferase